MWSGEGGMKQTNKRDQMTDWGTRAVYYAIGFRFIFQPERSLLMHFVSVCVHFFVSDSNQQFQLFYRGLSNPKSTGLLCCAVLCGAVLCARLYALNFEIGIESNQLVVSVIYINQFLEIKPAANVRRKKGENKGKKTTRFFFFFLFLSFVPCRAIRLWDLNFDDSARRRRSTRLVFVYTQTSFQVISKTRKGKKSNLSPEGRGLAWKIKNNNFSSTVMASLSSCCSCYYYLKI